MLVAPSGCVLLSGDYAQLEYRVLAQLSEDPTMMRLIEENADPFTAMQSYFQQGHDSTSNIVNINRDKAKTVRTYSLSLITRSSSLLALLLSDLRHGKQQSSDENRIDTGGSSHSAEEVLRDIPK